MCYFWSTHQEAEIDLFTQLKGKRIGIEFKTTDTPKITKSMRISIEALNLDHLYIVTPIETSFAMSDKVTVASLKDIQKLFL